MNYKGCHVCKEFAVLKVHERVVEEEDKEEKINFKRKEKKGLKQSFGMN